MGELERNLLFGVTTLVVLSTLILTLWRIRGSRRRGPGDEPDEPPRWDAPDSPWDDSPRS